MHKRQKKKAVSLQLFLNPEYVDKKEEKSFDDWKKDKGIQNKFYSLKEKVQDEETKKGTGKGKNKSKEYSFYKDEKNRTYVICDELVKHQPTINWLKENGYKLAHKKEQLKPKSRQYITDNGYRYECYKNNITKISEQGQRLFSVYFPRSVLPEIAVIEYGVMSPRHYAPGELERISQMGRCYFVYQAYNQQKTV